MTDAHQIKVLSASQPPVKSGETAAWPAWVARPGGLSHSLTGVTGMASLSSSSRVLTDVLAEPWPA